MKLEYKYLRHILFLSFIVLINITSQCNKIFQYFVYLVNISENKTKQTFISSFTW